MCVWDVCCHLQPVGDLEEGGDGDDARDGGDHLVVVSEEEAQLAAREELGGGEGGHEEEDEARGQARRRGGAPHVAAAERAANSDRRRDADREGEAHECEGADVEEEDVRVEARLAEVAREEGGQVEGPRLWDMPRTCAWTLVSDRGQVEGPTPPARA